MHTAVLLVGGVMLVIGTLFKECITVHPWGELGRERERFSPAPGLCRFEQLPSLKELIHLSCLKRKGGASPAPFTHSPQQTEVTLGSGRSCSTCSTEMQSPTLHLYFSAKDLVD